MMTNSGPPVMDELSEPLYLARPRSPVVEIVKPVSVKEVGENHWFFDFGRAAFGTVRFTVRVGEATPVGVHLGERLAADGLIDRRPRRGWAAEMETGCIRYLCSEVLLRAGTQTVQLTIPPDDRNTGPAAIRMPPELFEVLPFRYCELVIPGRREVEIQGMEQLVLSYPFNYDAAEFLCDDNRLNRVWNLCKYSIKATSFCGIYVDGDRERIPYEADAYINQLCHYGVDAEYELARHSLEYLLFHPTRPTEWQLHCVPMAWADYCYTGRTDFLRGYYGLLQKKALLPLARADGLISTQTGLVTPAVLKDIFREAPIADIIDWPDASFTDGGVGERDNYELTPVNTVVNAFHAWNLDLLGRIAVVLRRREDADFFRRRAGQVTDSLRRLFFRPGRGLFIDGEGSEHASLHANCFPAAFGLAPPGAAAGLTAFLRSRGMACSVYGAQYLLEACCRLGAAEYALELMTAGHDRGWLNMLRAGSTVTLEAWDWRYKNNLDWNHAWGAAPANIIPRFIAGVRPAQPGFATVLVAPQPGRLEHLEAKVPTPRGPVAINIDRGLQRRQRLWIDTPVRMRLDLSGMGGQVSRIRVNDREVACGSGRSLPVMPPGRYACELEPVDA